MGRADSYEMRCKPRGDFFPPRTHPDTGRTTHLKEQTPSLCPDSLSLNPSHASLVMSWAFSAHTVSQATSLQRPMGNRARVWPLTRAHSPSQVWPAAEGGGRRSWVTGVSLPHKLKCLPAQVKRGCATCLSNPQNRQVSFL